MTQAHDDRERQVTMAFVELDDTLVDDYDVIDVLDRLIGYSVELLAAEAAGIMLVDPRGRLGTVAYSSEESGWTESMQLQTDEGPCVDCVRTGEPVTVTDLDTAAAHWPRFAAALHERATPDGRRFRSVHALPLRLRGQAIGGMNLFHTRPGPLPQTDLRLGQALADAACIGILQERAVRHGEALTEQLHRCGHLGPTRSPDRAHEEYADDRDRIRHELGRPERGLCLGATELDGAGAIPGVVGKGVLRSADRQEELR